MPVLNIVRNEPAGTQLRLLTLDASLAGHERAGQFLTVSIGESKPAFFAIASEPGLPVQLLVKTSGTVAEALGAMPVGAAVTLSSPMGTGFPLERVAGCELVVLCNGSGISAVRPILHAEARTQSRPVHFYYGVLTPAHRSFVPELELWAQNGITVHTVVDAAIEGWTGPIGYVQHAAAADGLVRADVGVVLCGLPIMLEQARAAYEAAGCPSDRILVNF